MDEVSVGLIAAAAAGVLALGVPRLIGGLPEPEPPKLPDDPAEDSAYLAQLRSEGPKELYADLARQRWVLPAAVLISAVAGFLLGWRIGPSWWFVVGLVPLAPIGAALSIIDVRTRLLPTKIIGPTIAALAVYVACVGLIHGDYRYLAQTFIMMIAAYLIYFIIWFIYPAGMGFGDIRLSALLGLAMGWLGPNVWILSLFGGFFISAAYSLVLMARNGKSALKQHVPFGPFMLAGALLALLIVPWVRLLQP